MMNTLILSILSLCTLLLVGCNNGDSGLLDTPTSPVDPIIELNVEPRQSSVPIGFSQQMQAYATLDSGQVIEVTQDEAITWNTSDANIATISNSDNTKGLVTAGQEGVVTIIASGSANGRTFEASAILSVTDAVVTELIVEPVINTLPVGFEQQYRAEVILSNNQVLDVTQDSAISWQSSDTNIATVSNSAGTKGQVTARAVGEVVITASGSANGQVFQASAIFNVSNAVVTELNVEPATQSLPVGLEQQYSAKVKLSDNRVLDVTQDSAINWRVSDTNVASLNSNMAEKGLVKALQVGEVIVTASGVANGQDFEASAILSVTDAVVTELIVEPVINTLPVGFEQQYRAEVILSNNQVLDVTQDSAISWQSSDTNIATVSNSAGTKGQVTARAVGEVVITASGSANGQVFQASAIFNVSNAVVTELNVEPATQSLPVGLEQQYSAKVKLSDNRVLDVTQDSAINWRVSDTNVVSVNSNMAEKGLVKALQVGEVIVTASGVANGQDFEASAILSVTDAVVTELIVEPVINTLPVGLEQQYLAQVILSNNQVLDVTQDSAISWSTSDSNIAIVSNNAGTRGLVTALDEGSVTVTVSGSANGQVFNASANLMVTDAVVTQLLVEPSNSALPVGLEQQYIAKVVLSDKQVLDVTQDTAISWQSSDSSIASISNDTGVKGLLEAFNQGVVTITASGIANGQRFDASTTLTVTDATVTALQVIPLNTNLPEGTLDGVAIPVGLSQSYKAVATMSDGSTLEVTNSSALSWSSENSDVAIITSNLPSGNGVAEGLATGFTTISASGEDNGQAFIAYAQLEVTEAVVTNLEISPLDASVPAGLTQQFTAIATLSDDSTLDVTENAALNWSSDNSSVVTINPNTGLATGIATGVATITATGIANEQVFSASVELDVANAIISTLQVSPLDTSIPRGQTQQFVATAVLSDDSEIDVTNNTGLSWVSSAPQVAEIKSGLSESNGIAKGLTIGTTQVTATAMVNGTLYSANANLEVTDKDVSALQIEGAASIPVYNYLGSLTEFYQVIAEYSDGEIIEYPEELEWTIDITTPGLASFDIEAQSITTFPPEDEVAGDVIMTACTSQGVCSSKRVILFTRIIQILEGSVGGTDKSCEDIGYSSITIEAYREIFNSEYRPEGVANWAYRRGTWSYGLVANVYGRIEPYTETYIDKVAYIVTGADIFVTDTYDVLSTSYLPNHLICKID
ncbi:Ig-like domain-containing protein [Vibrio hyugaensis]|nr:Ig-like domain-containing protein [Vibrio hyugaensis]